MNGQPEVSGKKLTALRIVVGALAIGMISLVVIMQVLPTDTEPIEPKIMAIAIAGIAVMELGAYFALRMAMYSAARKRHEDSNGKPIAIVTQLYVSFTILSAAMAEGVGLFGAVASYVCAERLFLIAPGAALVSLVLIFPTAGRFAQCYESVTGNPLPTTEWPT